MNEGRRGKGNERLNSCLAACCSALGVPVPSSLKFSYLVRNRGKIYTFQEKFLINCQILAEITCMASATLLLLVALDHSSKQTCFLIGPTLSFILSCHTHVSQLAEVTTEVSGRSRAILSSIPEEPGPVLNVTGC